MKNQRFYPAGLVGLSLVAAAACSAAGDDAGTTAAAGPPGSPTVTIAADAGASADADAAVTFGDPLPLDLAKVKNILVGLPPTDEELASVGADPSALPAFIDGWMATPEYSAKMMRFFQLAFQQTQITNIDLNNQFYPYFALANGNYVAKYVQSVVESFSRTALALTEQDRPFTETVTTQQFMMTPALMEIYAFQDAWQSDKDGNNWTDRFATQHPNVQIVAEAAQGPIPITESIDPNSPNFMHWYNADVLKSGAPPSDPSCAADPVVMPLKNTGFNLHVLLWGTLNYRSPLCPRINGSAGTAQFQNSDFNTWKMVTIRPPRAGEKPTDFYDLPALRATNELVLETPRVGFFSTMAFFGNWPSNESNQHRVTANQTLIVALGSAIDGTDNTVPSSEPGLDGVHAGNPACFACHKTMDPTRSIFSSTYNWFFQRQSDPTLLATKGIFAFRGSVTPANNIAELGTALAFHPLFAPAWVQKLCYWANSASCDTSDPELQRIVASFQASGFSWRQLIRDFFSSPLTTNAGRRIPSNESGPVVAVSRRDHLCATLNNRLGFADICGLQPLAKITDISRIAAGMPSDGYARGTVAPVLANDPTFFYRAAAEAVCESAAAQVIDATSPPAGVKKWSSADPDAAITDFVHLLLGFGTADSRTAQATAVLQRHFADATKTATVSAALQSTFVVACLSPTFVGIGL